MVELTKIVGHSEILEDVLHDLVAYGTAVLSAQKLMRWTAAKRVTPKMWKYIHDLFDAVIMEDHEDQHGYKLYVGEGAETYSFLIWDRGEGQGAVGSPWWQPIEILEQPKKRSKIASGDDEEHNTADA